MFYCIFSSYREFYKRIFFLEIFIIQIDSELPGRPLYTESPFLDKQTMRFLYFPQTIISSFISPFKCPGSSVETRIT